MAFREIVTVTVTGAFATACATVAEPANPAEDAMATAATGVPVVPTVLSRETSPPAVTDADKTPPDRLLPKASLRVKLTCAFSPFGIRVIELELTFF